MINTNINSEDVLKCIDRIGGFAKYHDDKRVEASKYHDDTLRIMNIKDNDTKLDMIKVVVGVLTPLVGAVCAKRAFTAESSDK